MAETERLAPIKASDDLARVLAAHPLPHGVPDVDMNQAEVAQAMGVTTNTVGKWVARSVLAGEWREAEADFLPIVEAGGPGRPYVIRLSHVWAWSANRRDLEAARQDRVRSAQLALQAQFLGVDTDSLGDGLDHKKRRELAEADMIVNRAAIMRRQLVGLDEVTDLMESVLRIVRDGVEGMPDRLERELGLRSEQVALVNRIGDDILSGIAEAIEEAELRERDISDVEIGEQLVI